MKEEDSLVLEIFKQENALKMSIFQQKELASTLRHYSQCNVSFSEIEKLCLDLTLALNKADRRGKLDVEAIKQLKKTGQLLWDHLFTRPVKDKLKNTPISGLILSIDEELINIPWELSYDGSNFLCLNFDLGRLVRTREQASNVSYRSSSEVLKMLVMANPTNDLKSAYLEGINIRNQFDRKRNKVSIDFKSTQIDKLYVKKNISDYDIVHFAGHCEYEQGNANNSGWLFSDGKFSIPDILALGETASLPSLIFSNACYSAKVPQDLIESDYQEKNYSLASAFLFSGVRHYIGAIRKIEDEASLSFSKEFYNRLLSGKSIGESVRLSRLKLIKDYGISALPWASYLLYGDPNFVLFKSLTKETKVKHKKDLVLYKKWASVLIVAMTIIFLCIGLYALLPSVNPNSYILFLKSKKLFEEGNNQKIILLASEILNKDPKFLAVYPLMADTYRRLGDWANALKYYFDYAIYSEKKKDLKNLASAYIGIGWVYQWQGDYAKSFDFYSKALRLSKEKQDKLHEAEALRKLALWHIDKNELDKAMELLMKSSQINSDMQAREEHRYNLACDYFDIGLIFSNKDDFNTAKEFYAKSMKLFEKLKLKNELSDYYFNLGEICMFEKQYQKALDLYKKGLMIDETQGNKPNLAGDYIMLGELYLEMDNQKEAEDFFNKSVLISKQIDSRPELADAYYNLGALYKKQNHKNKAREYFRQAQEIYSKTDQIRYQEVKNEFLSFE